MFDKCDSIRVAKVSWFVPNQVYSTLYNICTQ